MSEVIGRAGFHVEHAKKVGERGAIVHEMMRELEDDSIAYWAARNPNIVIADEVLNEAMVNDGDGGFQPCTDRQAVLDYGAERVGRVKRKFREDTLDRKTGKMKGGTVTTTLIVSHLPKSMCVEEPDFYPVLDTRTGQPVLHSDGEPMRRSRWVARDRDEARRYFQDVVDYLTDEVIPGGPDAVLGYDIQHSESTPHIQIIADTFAPDPKDEDALRVESSQAWFSHRDVRDEQGRQKSGKTKMGGYHAGLKEHLIALGYDVSPDFDEARHLTGQGKEEYGRSMDAQRVAVAKLEESRTTTAANNAKVAEFNSQVTDIREEFETRKAALDEREGILDHREAELPRLRRRAVVDGQDEGRHQGYEEGRAAAKARADEAMKLYLRQLRMNTPALVDDFLDRKDGQGRSFRPIFEKFVDQRLEQFKAEHGVTDVLELEPGDRETFIDDGGEDLANQITQLQRDRAYGG